MLLTIERTDLPARDFVAQHCEVFAIFDANTQDSGNVSYGVRQGDERIFVKTAGLADAHAFLSYDQRVALLRNAIRLARLVSDATLPALRNVIECVDGPLLAYTWAEGELLGTVQSRRSHPASAFVRFRALPLVEGAHALDAVFRLHVKLARQGFIANDFYDG